MIEASTAQYAQKGYRMQTATHHSAHIAHQSQQAHQPADFVPLHQETRTHVTTAVMCRHLNRKAQTARGWACSENGPLRPLRINGRLAWSVDDIKSLLGVGK